MYSESRELEPSDSVSQDPAHLVPEATVPESVLAAVCAQYERAIEELEALCASYRQLVSDLRAENLAHERRCDHLYTQYCVALEHNAVLAREMYHSH